MNTMLEKDSRSSAVKKKIDRSKKITEHVPPTTPGISSHILTYFLLVLWFYFSLYMCIKHVLLHTKIIDLFVCGKDMKQLQLQCNITFLEKSHICLNLLPLNIVISHNPFLSPWIHFTWGITKGYCQFMFGENECWNFCFYVSVSEVQEPEQGNQPRTASKTPKRCSLCRHPMKGHSKVSTCPKNQKKQS